ncbi:MAG: L,D-transpeptidase family protein, partial [Firmicutes bacterium]|nr:L,D-transpeptidase family protein [Bacillota bacterium]
MGAIDPGLHTVPGRPRSVRIVIDRRARRLYVFSGGQRLCVYPCAVGKPSTPTPLGDYRVVSKDPHPDLPVLGSRWLGLSIPDGNYGIHGTNNPASIGQAVTNGCIRLHNRDVEELYDWASIGTPVSIVEGRSEPGGPGGGAGGGGAGGGGRPTLARGSAGPYVRELQERLQSLGFDPGPLDGIFGPRTEAAVIHFQRSRGL